MSENWELVKERDNKMLWSHENEDIMVHVSHQPDHFVRDDEEVEVHPEYEQVMRWHGWVTQGKNIAVGIHEYAFCEDEGSCDGAKQRIIDWAENWMENNEDITPEEL